MTKKTLQIDEEILTPEFIERVKTQDPRFAVLDLRLEVEQELREVPLALVELVALPVHVRRGNHEGETLTGFGRHPRAPPLPP